MIIKTTNLNTVNLVKTIMENSSAYKAIDETDVPELMVKILSPKWFEPLLDAKQFLKVITLHHPSVKAANFTQYQPSRKLKNSLILY